MVFREDTPDDVIELLDRSRAHPVADVVVGIDTLDVLFVVENGLTQSYVPLAPGPLTEGLAVEDHALTPVSYIDACLNYLPSFYVVPDRAIDELPDLDVLPPPGASRPRCAVRPRTRWHLGDSRCRDEPHGRVLAGGAGASAPRTRRR